MLGDNPFFGISHLGPSKSAAYLGDKKRWDAAKEIIEKVPHIGIDSFMISSHAETSELLSAVGYGGGKALPEICLVVPNVHDLNKNSAKLGILGAIKKHFKNIKSIRDLSPKRVFQILIMSGLSFREVQYVALHNVVVDLLLGLRARKMLTIFCWTCRLFGYKPVLITLNPGRLLQMNIRCHAICTYYNNRRYNVCDDPNEILDRFDAQNSVSEIWAMGVVASGVVSYEELRTDNIIQRYSRVLVASSKFERIQEMKKAIVT